MGTQDKGISALLDKAMNVDRSWMQFGSCAGWTRSRNTQDNPNPWFAYNYLRYGPDRDISGHELVKYALLVCASCVAQYDCARFAVRTHAQGVTSSMRVGDLRWLQNQPKWEKIVDIAEAVSIPMQQAVVTVRRGGRVDA